MRKTAYFTFITLMLVNFVFAASNVAKERQAVYNLVINDEKVKQPPKNLRFVGKWATVDDVKNFKVEFYPFKGKSYANVNLKFVGKVYNRSNTEIKDYGPSFILEKVGKNWKIVG